MTMLCNSAANQKMMQPLNSFGTWDPSYGDDDDDDDDDMSTSSSSLLMLNPAQGPTACRIIPLPESLQVPKIDEPALARVSSWGDGSLSPPTDESDEECSMEKAMAAFRKVLELLDGESGIPHSLPSQYEETFGRSLRAITKSIEKPASSPLVEMSYGEFYSQFVLCFRQGWKLQILDMQCQWPGTINYSVCMTKDTCKVTYISTAVVEDGKISRIRRKQTRFEEIVVERVSGQVEASRERRSEGLPSEAELSAAVFPLPRHMRGNLLAEGTALAPAAEAGQVIKVFVEHAGGYLSRNGRITLRDSNGRPYAEGTSVKKEFKQLAQQATFVLNDKNDRPVAKCVQDRGMLQKGYTIYGTRPLRKGDRARQKERGVDLFHWFRFGQSPDDDGEEEEEEEESNSSLDHQYLSIWTGQKFAPLWRTCAPGNGGTGGNKRDSSRRSGEILIQSSCGSHNYGFLKKQTHGKKIGWDVTIAPGVDPAVMICIAAILEDAYGPRFWAMSRIQQMPQKGSDTIQLKTKPSWRGSGRSFSRSMSK